MRGENRNASVFLGSFNGFTNLQTFYYGEIRSTTDVHMFEGTVYGVMSTLVVSAGRTRRTSFILPMSSVGDSAMQGHRE